MFNNDITLREKVRSFLQSKLDEIQGNALSFVLGKDFLENQPKDGDPFYEIKQLNGTYRVIEENFVPAMIDRFDGTYEPLKDLKVITYSLPVVFLVPVKNKFSETKEALQRFTDDLRGGEFVKDTFFFATNASEITNTEAITTLNGKEFTRFIVTITVSATETGLLGNFVETYFGETAGSAVRIYPTARTTSRAFIDDNTQWNVDKETFTLLTESTWTLNLSFLVNKVNPVCIPLIQHLEKPEMLNKTWYHKKDYGNDFAGSFEKEVVITNITNTDEIGEFALISLVLRLSGVNYGQ